MLHHSVSGPGPEIGPPGLPNARAAIEFEFWAHVMESMQNAKLHSSASIGKVWGGSLDP